MRVTFLIILSLVMAIAHGQTSNQPSYKAAYKIIDSLILKEQLIKTAIEKVDQLYKKAVTEKQEAEQIKALIYKAELENEVTEEGFNNTKLIFNNALSKANSDLLKAVIHTIIAKKYIEYYNNQRWILLSRKNWNLQAYKDSINWHFKAANQMAKALQGVNLDTYSPIISGGSELLPNYSLYHVFISEQIEYRTNELGNDDTKENQDSINQLYQAIFQLHEKDSNNHIAARFYLNYLDWKKQWNQLSESDYVLALNKYTNNNYLPSVRAAAWFKIANSLVESGGNFDALTDTTNQYDLKKALSIIQTAKKDISPIHLKHAGLNDLENRILQKIINLEIEKTNEPDQPFRAYVQYKNTDTLYYEIFKINPGFQIPANYNEAQIAFIKLQPKVVSGSVALPKTDDHQLHYTEIKFDGLKQGQYLLLASSHPRLEFNINNPIGYLMFGVSDWVYFKDQNKYFIRTYDQGLAVNNARVKIFETDRFNNDTKKNQQPIHQTITDNNGTFEKPKGTKGSIRIEVANKKSALYINEYEYSYENINNSIKEKEAFEQNNQRVFFFTDRSIYRPGQIVQFKGLAVTRDYETKQSKLIQSNLPFKIYLINANDVEIDSLTVKLNDYGSFNGQFTLPRTGLLGNFRIELSTFNHASKSIKVEEYKRPTIQLVYDQPTYGYRLNDTIRYTIKALAYAGNSINGAKVSYTVKSYDRSILTNSRSHKMSLLQDAELISGTGVTNQKGEFTVVFKALYDSTQASNDLRTINYNIQFTITDLNGESITDQMNLQASNKIWQVRINHPMAVKKSRLNKIDAVVIDKFGKIKNAKVITTVYKVIEPANPIRQRYWGKSDQFTLDSISYKQYFPNDEYKTESNPAHWPIELVKNDLNNLDIGLYKIKATAVDSFGLELTTEKLIHVYDETEGVKSSIPFHFYSNNYTKPGDTIQVVINYPSANQSLVRKTNKARSNELYQFSTSNQSSQSSLIINESDKGGININEAFIWKGRLYQWSQAIAVVFDDKQLKINTGSFRQINEPGAKETWTINIEGNQGTEKTAELLTSMYDASLDVFQPNTFEVYDLWNSNTSSTAFSSNLYQAIHWNLIYYDQCFCEAKPFVLPKLISTIPIPWRMKNRVLYETMPNRLEKSISGRVEGMPITIRGNNTIKEESYDKVYTSVETVDPNTGNIIRNGKVILKDQPNKSQVQIRKAFDETAFFFPQLYADSSGKYQFSFQFPDAVTQWKWMSFAHTKDLATGYAEQTILTQKSLMVQPNIPRFMREGDQMELSVKIANLTNQELTGTIVLELLDATTNTPVDGWFQNVFPQQYFTAEAGQSAIAQFPIQIPFSYNKPLTYRIIARTNEFSDGEENTVPVLSNRQLVTETLPLYLSRDTTQTFKFNKLRDNQNESISSQGLTVEYMTQPIWHAIHALGYLKSDPEKSAIQQFNRLYANLMALHILDKYLAIKKVLDHWKQDSLAIQNPLLQETALKQVLLEETPWVLDAQSNQLLLTTLANQLNTQQLINENEALLKDLSKYQLDNGGFSWFQGGRSDDYITRYILTSIGKLKRIGAITPAITIQLNPMITKALAYTDHQQKSYFKQSKPTQINATDLAYLYMKSFYIDETIKNDSTVKAIWQMARNQWYTQNQYGQAMIALIAHRQNETVFAKKILNALLENTITQTEQGMYWKNRQTFRWYAMPIEHQTMMIDCFSEINQQLPNQPYNQSIKLMMTWLIGHKMTNHWGNSIASAEAVYSLMANGQTWMNQKRAVLIELGKTTISTATEKTMEGSGYFKKRFDGDKVTPEMGNISVTTATQNTVSDQPSYGSIYWQYFANMDDISASQGPINIHKQLLVLRNKIWVPLKENEPINVGELMTVTLKIQTSKEMDYVHLKDLRPAATEPTNVLSGYQFQDNLFVYQSTKDVSNDYYIHYLPKGEYQFSYTIRATHKGIYTAGYASVQSMYAPSMKAHSNTIKLRIE